MLHLFALRLVCLQGVQHGNLNVVVSDDDTEETRFVLEKLIFSLLGSLQLLYVTAFFFGCIDFM